MRERDWANGLPARWWWRDIASGEDKVWVLEAAQREGWTHLSNNTARTSLMASSGLVLPALVRRLITIGRPLPRPGVGPDRSCLPLLAGPVSAREAVLSRHSAGRANGVG